MQYMVQDGNNWRLCWRDDGSFVQSKCGVPTSWPMVVTMQGIPLFIARK